MRARMEWEGAVWERECVVDGCVRHALASIDRLGSARLGRGTFDFASFFDFLSVGFAVAFTNCWNAPNR